MDPSHAVFISAVSIWEIGIKIGIGKLALQSSLEDMVKYAELDGFNILQIKVPYLLYVPQLSLQADHKDPFDRLIVAQAIVENCHVISNDTKLDLYHINRIW